MYRKKKWRGLIISMTGGGGGDDDDRPAPKNAPVRYSLLANWRQSVPLRVSQHLNATSDRTIDENGRKNYPIGRR